jgi:hypothetical protein
MTFRALLIVKALVCLIFGVFLLAAPSVLFRFLGGALSAAGKFAAREYGAAMIGTLLLTWLAKDLIAMNAKRAILFDLFVYDGIGVIITVAAILSGVLNMLGWGIVAVYLLFTAWSGVVLLKEGSGKRRSEGREA